MDSVDPREATEGLIVLHAPKDAEVDIVFVHGLGGHPYKTWACPRKKNATAGKARRESPSNTEPDSLNRPNLLVRLLGTLGCGSEGTSETGDESPRRVPSSDGTCSRDSDGEVYWPRDLLAGEAPCQKARILAYGYDSKVTRGYGNASQNNLFMHAKDLLYTLQREKPARMPVIFIAHSLGGLLVKEVLRRSEASEELEFKDIVKSTKGIIFLGTPHRGSPGMADLGETVRNIASTVLRVDSNATLLRALGTDSPELELGRESFTALWRIYGFRVKTFQEAWGISGVNVGPLNAKVVPDISSMLDDPREHAETISANHMDMCRFDSRYDAGYRKVSQEIGSMILSGRVAPAINKHGKAFLNSLSFPEMGSRRNNIQRALDETCNWLQSTPQYMDWINGTNADKFHGLLWIKGKPGSGKSTLMKDAVRRAELRYKGTSATTAAFFFNARGAGQLEKTPLGLYRSLLYQVLLQDVLALSHLSLMFERKVMFQHAVAWHQEELQDFLCTVFATSKSRPAVLFVDAMDECDDSEVRDLVRFFKNLSRKAFEAGADLKICFSSRHYPHISIDGCPEVIVEHHNRNDILLYIDSEAEDNRPIAGLKDEIFERSSGVFLWVVLAIAMLGKHGRGKSQKLLQQKLSEIPPELSTLFQTLFSHQDPAEADRVIRLMQLLLFGLQPLTQRQIHQALAFGGTSYGSFDEWKHSVDYLESDSLVHEMIIDLSKGLLEKVPSSSSSDDPTYQFIHETVREFFLGGQGFSLLHFRPGSIVGNSHSMIATCLVNYLGVEELRVLPDRSACKGLKADNPDLALLRYVCDFLFKHIEAAQELEVSQEAVLRRLSDDACEFLLRMAFSPFKSEYEAGSTILAAAIQHGVVKTAGRILKMGFSPNQPSAIALKYPLHMAVKGINTSVSGVLFKVPQLDMVNLLLQNGADVSLRNTFGQTALHIAATKNPSVLLAVLANKAYVDAQDSDGETPLHRAIFSSTYYSDHVKILLAHHARLDIRDHQGRTPLDVARNADSARNSRKQVQSVIKMMEEHLQRKP